MEPAPSSFLKDYGTLIIAIYGVFQVWVAWVWKLFFRRGRVENYSTNTIEIGYSNFGPTVGLYGTLVALHKETFIRDISILTKRKRDGASHQFNWLAFRSTQFTLGVNPNMTLELPAGFLVTVMQPHRYNIIFSDQEQWTEALPFMRGVENAWRDIVANEFSLHSNQVPNYAQLFDDLIKSGSTTSNFTNIQRLCYWEKGEYSLTIRILTANPKKKFLFSRKFNLSEEDVNRLRFNAVNIIADLCKQPNVVYNFAYPTLQIE